MSEVRWRGAKISASSLRPPTTSPNRALIRIAELGWWIRRKTDYFLCFAKATGSGAGAGAGGCGGGAGGCGGGGGGAGWWCWWCRDGVWGIVMAPPTSPPTSYGNSKRFGEQKAFKTHKTALRQRSFEVLLEYQIAGVAKCFLMRLKQEGHQLFDGHIKSQKKTSVGYAQIISMFPRSSDSKNLESRTTIN